MFYAADLDVHPQYNAYWVVRFPSKYARDTFLDTELGLRIKLSADDRAVLYAKRHQAFYDRDGIQMVPIRFFR